MKYRVYKAKNWVLRHRQLVLAIAVIGVFLGLPWLVNNPAIIGVGATERELPIYSVQRDNRSVSLTFDAAWGNEDTDDLIRILGSYNVRATFFVVGAWVDKFPESVRALFDAGHEIMSHSNNHEHFTRLSESEIIENLNTANDKIEAVTGVRPHLFRAPYGEYDDHVIRTVKSIGMTTIQWNVDSLDWKKLSASEITNRVLKKMVPGSIVLFHNAAPNTPEALPGIIEALIADGYQIVPVSELLLTGEYRIDHTGMQYRP